MWRGDTDASNVRCVRGDSGNNPREVRGSHRDFHLGQQDSFSPAEAEFDADFEVGLQLELNNPN